LALQLLLPGFALNSLAQVAATALLSLGKARTVAVLHLTQLPIYSVVLYSLTLNYGIPGAAAAWSARAALDCAALFLILRSAEAANRPAAA
jgi:Na+-driven multidrug efflux pump